MSCFDKLKIITSINYIKNIDYNKFKSGFKGGQEIFQYIQTAPSSLFIMTNPQLSELVIEFTSKILKDNFIHLINKDNIHECFKNINQLNICTLDIDNIINNSELVKCDVAKDIDLQDIYLQDIKGLKNYTNTYLVNQNNRWIL